MIVRRPSNHFESARVARSTRKSEALLLTTQAVTLGIIFSFEAKSGVP